MRTLIRTFAIAALLGSAGIARAADLDGGSLSTWWALPFAGMLLSIALLPLATPLLWHHHFGKITAGWVLLLLLPFTLTQGAGTTGAMLVHTLLEEYIPFIVLLSALFTVAGGIYLRGNLHGSPGLNVKLMAVGALLASFMGTTGASMLMIQPLIRANDNRKHVAHVIVFFIFIVSNAGGSLTPLGDPPLFLGFLRGVDFFWTARHILPQTVFLVGVLLLLFYLLDRWFFAQEGLKPVDPTPDTQRFGIDGGINFVLLAASPGWC
jgi:Na+/H+ antiporter NhaD/arsenite permease-like protein